MGELFDDNDEESVDEVMELDEDFEDIELDAEIAEVAPVELDARRRLEQRLEEKRLKDELEDFGDY